MQFSLGSPALFLIGLSIIGCTVVATRYWVLLQCANRTEQAQATVATLTQKYADLHANYHALREEIYRSQMSAIEPLQRKLDLDEQLKTLATQMNATSAAIYVPLRTDQETKAESLLFLAIWPETAQHQELRKKPIPMASYAGRCFTNEMPSIILAHSQRIDSPFGTEEVIGFPQHSVINVPLKDRKKTIGVLQLLEDDRVMSWEAADLQRAQAQIEPLAIKVRELLQFEVHLQLYKL